MVQALHTRVPVAVFGQHEHDCPATVALLQSTCVQRHAGSAGGPPPVCAIAPTAASIPNTDPIR
jgi:hypothetical protein